MLSRAVLIVAMVLLAAVAADAKESPESVLDDAKVLARKGDKGGAAARYGDAIAAAQAAGDLQAEAAAAESMSDYFDDLERTALAGVASTTSDAPSIAQLLAAAMVRLDPTRNGAYVSAPALALSVLQRATAEGEFGSVPDAAKVAIAHAAKAGSGRAADVVAKYAEGMSAVASGHFDEATVPLRAALTESVESGWTHLSTHIATELAATWMRLGQPVEATSAITTAIAVLEHATRPIAAIAWSTMVDHRLPDAPEAVRKPVSDLVARLSQGGVSSSGVGGRGGAGLPAVAEPISEVGKLLRKLGKVKPFVSVTRTPKRFEVQFATQRDEKVPVEFPEMVAYADAGGVWLAFHHQSVALHMVDLVGNRGGPGTRTWPNVTRAFILLAEGETWSVSKEGIVTVR